jgi:hypothetical protein
MKADKNAAGAEKRATKAFYEELGDEGEESFDPLHLLQKAEPAVPQRERFGDDDQGKQGKIPSWRAFQTP